MRVEESFLYAKDLVMRNPTNDIPLSIIGSRSPEYPFALLKVL